MSVQVTLSQDKVEAMVEVRRRGKEDRIEMADLKVALEAAGVRYGIDEDACQQVIDSVNERPPGSPVRQAVAKGTPAVDGEAGSFKLVVEYERDTVGIEDESGSIDFHERGSFTPIEKDQLIAEIVLATNGTPGMDVRGEEIKPQPGKGASLTAGSGTSLVGAQLRATREGDLRCIDDRIEVTDLIRVSGDLDFDMGSIECEGSVSVEGDVLPGFQIRAGGDVTIGGVGDTAEVTANGAVVIRQGVTRESRVTAKAQIKVGYVNNSYLESEGQITISKEALHSTVVSGDSVSVSGRVVGGGLHAQKDVEVGVAGHWNGQRTTLAAGVDPLKNLRQAKLTAQVKQAEAVRAKIQKMKDLVEPEEDAAIEGWLSRAMTKQEKSSEELTQLEEEDVSLAKCFVKVRKEAHPGVRIQIGPGELSIEDEYRSATFQYDSESGEVVGLFGSGGEK